MSCPYCRSTDIINYANCKECNACGGTFDTIDLVRPALNRQAAKPLDSEGILILLTQCEKTTRAKTIRECAALADKLNKDFLSSGYASIQPSGSFLERFAVDEYRIAILALLGGALVDNGESSQ